MQIFILLNKKSYLNKIISYIFYAAKDVVEVQIQKI